MSSRARAWAASVTSRARIWAASVTSRARIWAASVTSRARIWACSVMFLARASASATIDLALTLASSTVWSAIRWAITRARAIASSPPAPPPRASAATGWGCGGGGGGGACTWTGAGWGGAALEACSRRRAISSCIRVNSSVTWSRKVSTSCMAYPRMALVNSLCWMSSGVSGGMCAPYLQVDGRLYPSTTRAFALGRLAGTHHLSQQGDQYEHDEGGEI